MATRTVSVREVFDTTPFTSHQIGICSLCFLVVFLDGFDLTMIGVALPKIADTLKTSPAALGLAISAGMVGPLVGSIVLGTLADRLGRKQILRGCSEGLAMTRLLAQPERCRRPLSICGYLICPDS